MAVHTTGSTQNVLAGTLVQGGNITATSPMQVSVKTEPAVERDIESEQIIIGVPGDFAALEPATAHAETVETLHPRTDIYFAQSISGFNTKTGEAIFLATGHYTITETPPSWSDPGDFVFANGRPEVVTTGFQPRD